MHFPRSFVASAIVLSFSASVDAAVAQERADSAHSNNYWPLKDLFAKRQEPETTDSFVVRNGPEWRVLSNADPEDTKLVCNKLIGPLDPTTITVDYTPAAT